MKLLKNCKKNQKTKPKKYNLNESGEERFEKNATGKRKENTVDSPTEGKKPIPTGGNTSRSGDRSKTVGKLFDTQYEGVNTNRKGSDIQAGLEEWEADEWDIKQ